MLKLNLMILSAVLTLPLATLAFDIVPPTGECQTKMEKLEAMGLSQNNIQTVSVYSSNISGATSKSDYILIAELGNDRLRDGVYRGWLKVLNTKTGALTVMPMTSPGRGSDKGAFRLNSMRGPLEVLSGSLKGSSSLQFGGCSTAAGGLENKICLSGESEKELNELLGGSKPLLVTTPGTSDTNGHQRPFSPALDQPKSADARNNLGRLQAMYTPNACAAFIERMSTPFSPNTKKGTAPAAKSWDGSPAPAEGGTQ